MNTIALCQNYTAIIISLLFPLLNFHCSMCNRLGEPDDCAGTVSFLCSDDSLYITGETIVIAGGTQSRL